jgi:hypothetical protein
MGDPHWATSDPSGPRDALAVMSELQKFTRGLMPAGLHFDVEPWMLPDWDANAAAYTARFVRFVQTTVGGWRSGGLPGALGFALPFWFGALSPVLSALDGLPGAYVNAMTYRDHVDGPGGTAEGFDGVVAAARATGSSAGLMVGQELGPFGFPSNTYAGHPWSDVAEAIARLRVRYGSLPAFVGVALDDSVAILRLRSRTPGRISKRSLRRVSTLARSRGRYRSDGPGSIRWFARVRRPAMWSPSIPVLER